jgi:hypothetical protein
MVWKPPFPPAAQEYIRTHAEEWPSVLAYKVGVLFNYPCTRDGVNKFLKRVRRINEAEKAV